jgi:hypothetical protein
MDFQKAERIVSNQIRFISSLETEYEKRHCTFSDKLDDCRCIEEAEIVLLDHVNFTSKVLEALRKHNKMLKETLEMSYAKFIGLGTPYEKTIHILRETKHQLDTYLKILREEMVVQMKRQMKAQKGYVVTPKKY